MDFDGQYNQLIARRVRDQHVYVELKPYNKISVEEIKAAGYKGVIFTGGPNSVYDPAPPHYDPALLEAGIPICDGGVGIVAEMPECLGITGFLKMEDNIWQRFGNI